jgi:type IV pilus assembly protein PilW
VSRAKQAGAGIIEIMISLVLGLLVTGALLQVYLSTRQTYRTEDALSRRQEALRYSVLLLSHDLRMAGYRGCLRDNGSTVNYRQTNTAYPSNFRDQVAGSDGVGGAWTPALTGTGITSTVNDTDTLTVRFPGDTVDYTTTNMPTNTSDVQITAGANPTGLAVGSKVLVADCGGSAVFEVTGYSLATGVINHGAGANTDTSLVRKFPAGAEVMVMTTTSYFIRNSASGSGPALWRVVNSNAAEELAEGVDNMQVRYGEDTDGDFVPDAWRTAAEVSTTGGIVNWRNITAVRVGLLLASPMPPSTGAGVAEENDPRIFTLLDPADFKPGPFTDRKLRRVINFVVTLRNRVI